MAGSMRPVRSSDPHGRERGTVSRGLLFAFLAIFLLGLFVAWLTPVALRPAAEAWDWRLIGALALTFFFGASVGLSEILTRYRDEPLRATLNLYGVAYLTLNGAISLAALGLLLRYKSEIFPTVAGDLLLTSVVAGFGAMVVMRSKLFTFKSADGSEFAVGPAIVIDTVLQTIDSKIDRLRAAERQERVYEKLHDITDFDKAAQYLEGSLLSFQNLSDQQKADIHTVITDYRSSTWDNRLKVMAVGFAFLTIAGEENFDQVVENLKNFLKDLKDAES